MDTVNGGGQARWRTVPASSDGHPLVVFTGRGRRFTCNASSGGGDIVVVGAARPRRVDEPEDGVPGDDPRSPDQGQRQHFQRLCRRYGHHVVAAPDQHGHHKDDGDNGLFTEYPEYVYGC